MLKVLSDYFKHNPRQKTSNIINLLNFKRMIQTFKIDKQSIGRMPIAIFRKLIKLHIKNQNAYPGLVWEQRNISVSYTKLSAKQRNKRTHLLLLNFSPNRTSYIRYEGIRLKQVCKIAFSDFPYLCIRSGVEFIMNMHNFNASIYKYECVPTLYK